MGDGARRADRPRWPPRSPRATRHSPTAFAALAARRRRAATAAADAALKSQRRVEHVYRAGDVGARSSVDDLREVAARRELYRRLARTSDDLVDVAERVWYSVLKES